MKKSSLIERGGGHRRPLGTAGFVTELERRLGRTPQWRRSITCIEESAQTSEFKAKMQSEAAQKIYQQRSQIAEFPHAWIKERCGLRQFRCRGQQKTGMEATWACLSYNIIRLFSVRRKIAELAVAAAA